MPEATGTTIDSPGLASQPGRDMLSPTTLITIREVGMTGAQSKIVAVAVAVLVIGGLAVGAWWLLEERETALSLQDLLHVIPDDADAVILLRGGPELADGLRLWTLLDELEARDEAFRRHVAELTAELGFDPTERDEVTAQGLDLFVPTAVSFHTRAGGEGLLTAAYLPVSDEERLDSLVRKLSARHGAPLQELEHEGKAFVGSDDRTVQYTFHEGYLVGAMADEGAAVSDFLARLVDGEAEPVEHEPWLVSLAPLQEGPWEVLALIDPKLSAVAAERLGGLAEGVPVGGPLDLGMADLLGVGIATHLSADAIQIEALATAPEEATEPLDALIGAADDALVERIPGNALAAGRVALDLPAVLDRIAEEPEAEKALGQGLAMARGLLGVDVEALVRHLGSPISLAVLEGGEDERIPVGAALWAPVDDEVQVGESLASVEASLSQTGMPVSRDEVGETTWTTFEGGLFELRWGLARGHLVVLFGRTLAPRIAAALTEPEGSFLDGIERTRVHDGLTGQGDAFFYVGFPSIVDVVRRAAGEERIPEELEPLLGALGDLYGYTDYEAHRATSGATLHAAREDGFTEALHAAALAEREE